MGLIPPYRRKYSAMPLAEILAVGCGTPVDKHCIFLRRLTFTGHGRSLFIRRRERRECDTRVYVASSRGGEFDPSLARFYVRAENNLHNGRCARHAGTIADEFTHFLTIRVPAGISGAKCFRTGSRVWASIKDLERTASRNGVARNLLRRK